MNTGNIKEHLSDYKWIYLICTVILLLIIGWVWYEYKYPCIRGHHEQQWQTTYCYNSNGMATPCGGYFIDVFVCDCRTVRDSIK